MDVQAVFAEANTWPAEDQIRLLEKIWEKLVDEGSAPVITPELGAELDRRCNALDANPSTATSWATVEARAHLRFSK